MLPLETMQDKNATPLSTIDYYERNASALRHSYDAAEMSALHDVFLRYIVPGANVMDIGFGSGRDLAFLREHGYGIWGIDPSRQFVNIVRERFPDIPDHFYQSALPDLPIPHELKHTFDAVILIALWMHLPKAAYEQSVEQIVSLLRPSGRVIISYSITPREDETERYFEEVDSVLLNRLFERHGCTRIARSENGDGLQERAIMWRTEVFEKRGFHQ